MQIDIERTRIDQLGISRCRLYSTSILIDIAMLLFVSPWLNVFVRVRTRPSACLSIRLHLYAHAHINQSDYNLSLSLRSSSSSAYARHFNVVSPLVTFFCSTGGGRGGRGGQGGCSDAARVRARACGKEQNAVRSEEQNIWSYMTNADIGQQKCNLMTIQSLNRALSKWKKESTFQGWENRCMLNLLNLLNINTNLNLNL